MNIKSYQNENVFFLNQTPKQYHKLIKYAQINSHKIIGLENKYEKYNHPQKLNFTINISHILLFFNLTSTVRNNLKATEENIIPQGNMTKNKIK